VSPRSIHSSAALAIVLAVALAFLSVIPSGNLLFKSTTHINTYSSTPNQRRISSEASQMDWSGCDIVEIIPGKVSGVPLVRNTRVPAETIAESAELGERPEEIAYNYDLRLEDVLAILAYAQIRPLIAQAS